MATQRVTLLITARETATRAVGRVRGAFERLRTSLVGPGGLAAAFTGLFSAVALTRFVRGSISAFQEQEDAVNSLRVSLINTGKDGAESLKAITEEAARLQRQTRAGDEALIAAVSTLNTLAGSLSTNDLVESQRAIIAIGDTFLGGDYANAALLLGKSLGSATNALTRYGIELDTSATAGEKLNQVLSSDALQAAFEISKAQSETLAGRLIQLRNAWGDLREELGGIVVDSLSVKDTTEDLTGQVQDWTEALVENRAEHVRNGQVVFQVTRALVLGTKEFIAVVGELFEITLDLLGVFTFELLGYATIVGNALTDAANIALGVVETLLKEGARAINLILPSSLEYDVDAIEIPFRFNRSDPSVFFEKSRNSFRALGGDIRDLVGDAQDFNRILDDTAENLRRIGEASSDVTPPDVAPRGTPPGTPGTGTDRFEEVPELEFRTGEQSSARGAARRLFQPGEFVSLEELRNTLDAVDRLTLDEVRAILEPVQRVDASELRELLSSVEGLSAADLGTLEAELAGVQRIGVDDLLNAIRGVESLAPEDLARLEAAIGPATGIGAEALSELESALRDIEGFDEARVARVAEAVRQAGRSGLERVAEVLEDVEGASEADVRRVADGLNRFVAAEGRALDLIAEAVQATGAASDAEARALAELVAGRADRGPEAIREAIAGLDVAPPDASRLEEELLRVVGSTSDALSELEGAVASVPGVGEDELRELVRRVEDIGREGRDVVATALAGLGNLGGVDLGEVRAAVAAAVGETEIDLAAALSAVRDGGLDPAELAELEVALASLGRVSLLDLIDAVRSIEGADPESIAELEAALEGLGGIGPEGARKIQEAIGQIDALELDDLREAIAGLAGGDILGIDALLDLLGPVERVTGALDRQLTTWQEIGAEIVRATQNTETWGQVQASILREVVEGVPTAFENATRAAIEGNKSIGDALKGALLNAIASVARANAQFYAAKAVAALGEGLLGNPAGFAAAAKFTAAAAAFGVLAGALSSSGGAGGSGGGGVGAGTQEPRIGDFEQAPATIVIQGGGLLNLDDPDVEDQLRGALEDIGNRRVTVVRRG